MPLDTPKVDVPVVPGAVSPVARALDLGWVWTNRFAALGEAFFSAVAPTPLAAPYWVATSESAGQALGLRPHWSQSGPLCEALTGNTPIAGTQTGASVYSGHQFGQWAGQLGDGRALLLGETANGWEIQLKGAGLTPYSRMGDGRAVLRSSVREFLCSEAMHALGIPTTRALCVTGSDARVLREEPETAAVVTRLAPSFVRFGHFEHFCHGNQHAQLRQLADFVIDQHYPDCNAANAFKGNRYANLLHAVSEATALTLAQWQAVGFCHGVMNTDNMSILGLTLDYGPFQFLDGFDPNHICNHSDNQGRYAFGRQPNIAYWNLHCLGQALLPLIGETELAVAALESYKSVYPAAFEARMRAKLGLADVWADDRGLIETVLKLLAAERTDYTIFWRRLSHWTVLRSMADASVRDLFIDRSGIDAWLLLFSERHAQAEPGLAAQMMLKTNPKFVLRNYLGQQAIDAAKRHDFSGIRRLQNLLETPFDEHPGYEAEADFPPGWASNIEISCSS